MPEVNISVHDDAGYPITQIRLNSDESDTQGIQDLLTDAFHAAEQDIWEKYEDAYDPQDDQSYEPTALDFDREEWVSNAAPGPSLFQGSFHPAYGELLERSRANWPGTHYQAPSLDSGSNWFTEKDASARADVVITQAGEFLAQTFRGLDVIAHLGYSGYDHPDHDFTD